MKVLSTIIGGTIGIFSLYILYNSFLTPKKNKLHLVILTYIITGVYGMLYPVFTMTQTSRLCCTFLFLIFPLFIYKDNFSFKLLLVVIYYIIGGFAEFLIKAILLGFLGDFTLFYQTYEYHYFLGVIFANVLTFALVYFLTIFVRLTKQKLPFYLYCFLFLVPISTGLLFYYLQELVFLLNQQSVYNAYCYITFMLLIFNLSVIFTVSQVSQTSWLKARLEYEQNRIHEQQTYHKNLADYHQKIRQIYHDLNNHLLIIHHALQKQDIAYALQYVEKQSKILSQNQATYTGILLLDTILDEKKQAALHQETRYTIFSQLQAEMKLDDECLQDFSLMLAACLDNALEATSAVTSKEKRFIKIHLKNDKHYLYCTLENSVQENIFLDGKNLPPTSKDDTLLHGLGLHHVKELAEKHDGQLFLECNDYRFAAKFAIMISG